MSLLYVLLTCFCVSIAASRCSNFSMNIKSTVKVIGNPITNVKIIWELKNKSLHYYPVRTQLYYHKPSRNDTCNCDSNAKNIDAGCQQISKHPEDHYACNLNSKAISDLSLNYNLIYAICIVIEVSSRNYTEYSFLSCTAPPSLGQNCVNVCPPPSITHINASKQRELAVTFEAPDSISGNGLLYIAVRIMYRRAGGSAKNVTHIIETKKHRTFVHVIGGLEPYTKYEVHICCYFLGSANKGCPFSEPRYVMTAEEAPYRSPVVTDARRASQHLLITIKLPPRPTWNSRLLRYEIKVWKSDGNCTAVSPNSNVTSRKITITAGLKEQVNVPVQDGPSCFRVRFCSLPGCSPWSEVHKVQDSPTKTIKKTASSMPGNHYYFIIFTSSAVGGFLLMLFGILYCLNRRCNQQNQTLLPDDIDRESLTSTTDIDEQEDDPYTTVQNDSDSLMYI